MDVPNLLSISKGGNFDDFFYDKHLFYFTPNHLVNWLEAKGFSVLYCNEESCIEILARKISPPRSELKYDGEEYHAAKNTISQYLDDLEKNRNRCSASVLEIQKWSERYNNVAVYGCGRLLDTFLTYGGLDLNRFDVLVDNFLSKCTDQLYGREVVAEGLVDFETVDAVLVMTRGKSESFISGIKERFVHADVKHHSDFSVQG